MSIPPATSTPGTGSKHPGFESPGSCAALITTGTVDDKFQQAGVRMRYVPS